MAGPPPPSYYLALLAEPLSRKESRFLPAFSAATSQSGGRPRPVHLLPLSSAYFTGTRLPLRGPPRFFVLLRLTARLQSPSDRPCRWINATSCVTFLSAFASMVAARF